MARYKEFEAPAYLLSKYVENVQKPKEDQDDIPTFLKDVLREYYDMRVIEDEEWFIARNDYRGCEVRIKKKKV